MGNTIAAGAVHGGTTEGQRQVDVRDGDEE